MPIITNNLYRGKCWYFKNFAVCRKWLHSKKTKMHVVISNTKSKEVMKEYVTVKIVERKQNYKKISIITIE